MKYVIKGNTPQLLLDWIQEWLQEDGTYHGNCHYNQLTSKEKTPIQKALMEEQGFICCYTGHEIDEATCHIEHIKPRAVSDSEGKPLETLYYDNMVAAYPRQREKSAPYGAHVREDKPIFITPLMPDCEQCFAFLPSGVIDKGEQRANLTVDALQLNDPVLVEIRRNVIDEAIYQSAAEMADSDEVLAFLKNLITSMDERDSANKLKPFCFVIKQVALSLVS